MAVVFSLLHVRCMPELFRSGTAVYLWIMVGNMCVCVWMSSSSQYAFANNVYLQFLARYIVVLNLCFSVNLATISGELVAPWKWWNARVTHIHPYKHTFNWMKVYKRARVYPRGREIERDTERQVQIGSTF